MTTLDPRPASATAASALDLAMLRDTRAHNPGAIGQVLATRQRRDILGADGRLFIVAADHPARGAVAVGTDPTAMANREELLGRLAAALSRPGVDGVLGTPDIIDDLALLGLLDDKVVVGSMNRGGLRGASFEMDDRYTAYTVDRMLRDRIDFAKNLVRINLSDAGSLATLETTARVVNEASDSQLPIMLEPFMSSWVGGRVQNDLSTDAVILSIAIASGLGHSSAYSWLKLPVVPEMERVMASTTLPTLLLGGEVSDDQDAAFDSWSSALSLPNVRGLVVGRSLLYPPDGDVVSAVDTAAALVHG
ncbi:hypothetical protein GCM10009792_07840 [Microcella alkalica]|uniref:Cgl0159-like domain-containing protein n=1 Tax=Microcella alkalica TaxID=355930 RepID=A0A839E8J4_9MICO|nr:hypothetical protein [Microcella alkalica]